MKYLEENKNYREVPITDWKTLVKKADQHSESEKNKNPKERWIFRGHPKEDYPLLTYLERAIADIGTKNKNDEKDSSNKNKLEELEKFLSKEFNGQPIGQIEKGLIRRFQRQYYHFDLRVPPKHNILEWLALMRHYGAPTRLLDWTYSFYIAVFFALEQAEGECAVWALETESLRENVRSVLGEEGMSLVSEDEHIERCETWRMIFASGKLFVFPVNPFQLNKRLVLQQGVFLCPGDITKLFEENLAAVLSDNNNVSYKLLKYKIAFDVKKRQEALLNLHRMNINKATLFPGLDGFAQSLKTLLVSPANLLAPGNETNRYLLG
jgi:hypothetical protein